MTKSKSYWENRHTQWLNNQSDMDDRVAGKLKKEYDRTAKELEKDIARYFQKYGKDNVIEFRTMMQDLSQEDKNMLFKDMEAFAEKYPEHAHLMPVRESVYKLNRMQGLHYSTQMKLLELGVIEQKELEKHLEKTYGKHYKNMLEELGIGNQFLSVNDTIMRNTIFSKWVNNENFSDRIWENKDNLLNHLTTVYRDGIARGDNYARLTKDIMERFEVGASDARRLVWTEANFVLNQSHVHAYFNAGMEEYEISAIMDSKTSRICRSMDGKVFRFDEMEVGVNFPPFHPWCRTTFIGLTDGLQDDETQLLPNYEDAVIPEEKLTKYALDLNGVAPDKAIAFDKALGYNKDNYEELIKNIRDNLPKYKSTVKGKDQYGQRYQVIMRLTGANGKSANVLTGWILDAETGKTRLTSIYVTNKGV